MNCAINSFMESIFCEVVLLQAQSQYFFVNSCTTRQLSIHFFIDTFALLYRMYHLATKRTEKRTIVETPHQVVQA